MELASLRRKQTIPILFLVLCLGGYPCNERALAGDVEDDTDQLLELILSLPNDDNELSIPSPRGDGEGDGVHVVRGGWTEYDGRTNEGTAITSDGSEVKPVPTCYCCSTRGRDSFVLRSGDL